MAITTLVVVAPTSSAANPTGAGFKIVKSDLEFILAQIKIAEAHQAAGGGTGGTSNNSHTISAANALGRVVPSSNVYVANSVAVTDIASPLLMNGLRQVDGRNNNLTTGFTPWAGFGYLDPSAPATATSSTRNFVTPGSKSALGAADQPFPRTTTPGWKTAFGDPGLSTVKSYSDRTPGTALSPNSIYDTAPRTISNLIADQSTNNPAAIAAAGCSATPWGASAKTDCASKVSPTDGESLLIKNTATNAGVAAPYNGMFALFGQFFDHGLDLVGKSATDKIIVPILPGDPLYGDCVANFRRGCTLTMTTGRTVTPAGADAGINTTTPWVDQNQTYTSHQSHQVFLREYTCTLVALKCSTSPKSTGKLLDGLIAGNIANWADVKDQAAKKLGILLTDADITNIPLIVTNEYGRFIPGPNGFPQLVKDNAGTISFVEGNPTNPISTTDSVRIGHAFLDDIANFAFPYTSTGVLKTPDTSTTINNYPGSDCPVGASCYDNELLDAHYITGDGRGNENIGLTAVHTVFHAEHNRLWQQIQDVINADTSAAGVTFKNLWLTGGTYNGEYLFQASRMITEMEYQHLVFGEFARKVQPAIKAFVAYDPTLTPDITAEFADAVYRYGHSQLNETIDRKSKTGGNLGVPLLYAFLNPTEFNQAHTYDVVTGAATNNGSAMDGHVAAGSIVRGMVNQTGNEIDEFVTGALRNSLLGVPLDLATLNLMRGRDSGMASLNAIRRDLYNNSNGTANGNTQLAPYESWEDFHMNLRHSDSIVNFVAAYGTHTSITNESTLAGKRAAAKLLVDCDSTVTNTPADCGDFMLSTGDYANDANGITKTGLDDVDLWIGGLAEARTQFGSMLGSTFDYFFKTQLENLQESDRFYYLGRLAGTNLVTQLETNFLSDIVMRNTDATGLPADIFAVPTQTFDMDCLVLNSTNCIDATLSKPSGPTFYGANLTKLASGVWKYSGTNHVVFNGSLGDDRFATGSGDDTLRGDEGNDWINGGAGNDFVFGGMGNDVIVDSSGVNVLVGGDGNDYINGAGTDSYNGNDGNDFLYGGNFPNIMLASLGDDFIYGGSNNDTASGDDGNDWMEGGPGGDSLLGDNLGAAGVTLGGPGLDVLIGGAGDDLLDGLDGTDIFVPGFGSDLNTGGIGFDWATYFNDGQTGIEADLTNLNPAPGAVLPALADQFQEVEGLSGGIGNDFLSGDSLITLVPAAPGTGTNVLLPADLPAINGLASLLPIPNGVNRNRVTTWATGNILLGGPGNDVIEGRGGDDLIDGDAFLSVWISIPYVSGSTDPAVSWGIPSSANAPTAPTGRALVSSMSVIRSKIQALMTSGAVADPISMISIYRVVSPGTTGATDTAVYLGAYSAANYSITSNTDGTVTITDLRAAAGGVVNEGTDTLRGIEKVRFNLVDYNLAAPAAPTITSAVANAAANSVVVNWNQAALPAGSLPITGYTATMTPAVGGTPLTCTAAANARTCTITALTAGATYNLTVSVANPLVATSASQSVVVSAAPVAPLVTSVASGTASGTVDVNFTYTVPTAGLSALSSVTAWAWDSAVAGTKTAFNCSATSLTSGTGTCTITGLTAGTNYYIEVVATNAANVAASSARSVAVLATPTSATAADPALALSLNVSASATNPTINSTITITAQVLTTAGAAFAPGTAPLGTVTWAQSGITCPVACFASATSPVDANGFARVTLNVGTTVNPTASVSATWVSTATITGSNPLVPQTLSNAGVSLGIIGVASSGVPLTPAVPTVTKGTRSATVAWSASIGATSYKATAWQSSTSTTIVSSCSTTTAITCSIPRLTAGLTYWVDIVAINAAGSSTPTARISVKP